MSEKKEKTEMSKETEKYVMRRKNRKNQFLPNSQPTMPVLCILDARSKRQKKTRKVQPKKKHNN